MIHAYSCWHHYVYFSMPPCWICSLLVRIIVIHLVFGLAQTAVSAIEAQLRVTTETAPQTVASAIGLHIPQGAMTYTHQVVPLIVLQQGAAQAALRHQMAAHHQIRRARVAVLLSLRMKQKMSMKEMKCWVSYFDKILTFWRWISIKILYC